jgi:hypothetical protein
MESVKKQLVAGWAGLTSRLAGRLDKQLQPLRVRWEQLPDRVVHRLVQPLVIIIFSRYKIRLTVNIEKAKKGFTLFSSN